MATAQYDHDARKRRRRQNGLLLALFAALLATAIFADGLFLGESETPWQVDLPVSRALPRPFARSADRKHGVTMPIGRPALSAGRGGPADTGDLADEGGGARHWFLDSGYHPVDGFVRNPFVLPTRRFGSFSSPVGGFRGFPGGAGGGSGSGDTRVIPREAPVPEIVTGGDDAVRGVRGDS